MKWWNAIKRALTPRPSNPPGRPIAVRCNRCGEVISTRINLYNDLSAEEIEGETRYVWRKILVGSGENLCFQRIEVELVFDQNRRIIDRTIHGGTFVEEEEA